MLRGRAGIWLGALEFVVGVVLGANAASDAIAIASSVLVHALMHHENVISATDTNTKLLVGTEAVGTNFKLWWQSIVVLGNGNFFGQTLGFSTAFAFAGAAITVAAVLLAVYAAACEAQSR
jgi:hypothetical protein